MSRTRAACCAPVNIERAPRTCVPQHARVRAIAPAPTETLVSTTEHDIPAELLAVLAHDMRNPLAALETNLTFVEGALGATDDVDVREALADAIALCGTLQRLTRNVQALARGERPDARAPTALAAVARAAVARLDAEARAASVQLVLFESADPVVSVAREPLAAALENVLAHAIELAPRASTIAVEIVGGERDAAIEVRHDGPPVPEELRADAVSLRAHAAARRRGARLGRGLALLGAHLSACAAGARLEIGEAAHGALLRLVAARASSA